MVLTVTCLMSLTITFVFIRYNIVSQPHKPHGSFLLDGSNSDLSNLTHHYLYFHQIHFQAFFLKCIFPTIKFFLQFCHGGGGGGGVDPIPCVSTHRISDPRSGPAQLLPPHVKQRSHPHGVRPQIPDR